MKTQEIIQKMCDGIQFSGYDVYAKNVAEGRFSEEVDMDVCLKSGLREELVFSVKIFHGRPPDYGPWIEIFNIDKTMDTGKEKIDYFDSKLEDELLSMFASALGPGEHIHIEYLADDETRKELHLGVPPVATRLGYKLFNLGFSWFKDWYFSEGFKEGGMKLQAEKPMDEGSKLRQIKEIKEELEYFLKNNQRDKKEPYVANSLKRAKELLNRLNKLK